MATDITPAKREKAQCSGDGCSKPSWAKGYCKTHYSRWRIHGDANKVLGGRRLPAACEAPGCEQLPHTRWKKGIAVCNPHWQMLYRYGQLEAPPTAPLDPLPLCTVHKCKNEVRSRNAGLCEKHYGRLRRNGDPEALARSGPMFRYETASGYIKLLQPEHPLSDSKGYVFEHRLVAHDVRSGACDPCYWCGKELEWSSAVIDHMNEIKDDNSPGNLVVACNPCNRARGAMLPFLRRMRCEAVDPFIETVKAITSDVI